MRCLIAGIGSPHGDDQVGWKVVEVLARRVPADVRVVAVKAPLGLLDELAGVDRLILVDGCRGGNPPGTIVRLAWPAEAVAMQSHTSSHGFDLGAVLRLAEALERLPREVVLYAIEVEHCHPGAELGPALARALPEVCHRVLGEASPSP
jgi:hydrogenase maturation protease